MESPRLEKLQSIIHKLWRQLRFILEAGKAKGRFEFDSTRHTVHFIVGTLIFSRSSPFLDPVFQDEHESSRPTAAEIEKMIVELTTKFILNGIKSKI